MRIIPAILALLALTSPVRAEPGLKAIDGWIREAPPTAPVRAGYLVLRNEGVLEQAVVAASSNAFGAIEIHEMIDKGDGTMRMRPVASVVVPVDGEVALEPDGLHLMLFRPARSLAVGERVGLTLQLADGGTIQTTLEQR